MTWLLGYENTMPATRCLKKTQELDEDNAPVLDADGNAVYNWKKKQGDLAWNALPEALLASAEAPQDDADSEVDGVGAQALYKTDTLMAVVSGRGLSLDKSATTVSNSVTVQRRNDDNNRIENFSFADGTLMDVHDIETFKSSGATSDSITTGKGRDFIVAGDGNDLISAGAGADIVAAGRGDDTLQGADGNDFLYGGKGDDTIYGGNGDDYLIGEDGNDVLTAWQRRPGYTFR